MPVLGPPATCPSTSLLHRVRESVIGAHAVVDGPYGSRPLVYADWTASGRSLTFVEDYLREQVLPTYANTHTETSVTGRVTTRLRAHARAQVAASVGADDSYAVLFCGSGSTGAVDRLVGLLGLRLPERLDTRYGLSARIPARDRPVVLVGPHEHHSNELPWRESLAQVVVVPEDRDGRMDTAALGRLLAAHAGRPLLASFSAASNVTGIVTDPDPVCALVHRHGGLVFWDYAAGGPYLPIRMRPRGGRDPLVEKDAVFLSPHKLAGGPGSPGVLVVRRSLLRNRVPAVVGGGTVRFVSPWRHDYVAEAEVREEAGTPAIVESVRAGVAFQLKDALGTDLIRSVDDHHLRIARQAWDVEPAIELLGSPVAERLPILSFRLRAVRAGRWTGGYLHHNLVASALNDLFGIQARAGCSCAGPYGHRLLGIDEATSEATAAVVAAGYEGIKPGWTRVSLSYAMSEDMVRYVVEAVLLLARHGCGLLPAYRFDPRTGMWTHRASVTAEPPYLDLPDLVRDGSPRPPRARAASRRTWTPAELPHYLRRAREVLGTAGDDAALPDGRVTPAFDALRWFELPGTCLLP